MKSVRIGDEWVKRLKVKAAQDGKSIKDLIELALGSLFGQQPAININPTLSTDYKIPSEIPSASTHVTKIAELKKLQEEIINKPTGTHIPAQDSLAQEYGICPFCYIKKSKPVTLVTYLDQDQIKVEDKLCNECITKSKGSGSFVGLGGLNET